MPLQMRKRDPRGSGLTASMGAKEVRERRLGEAQGHHSQIVMKGALWHFATGRVQFHSGA